MQSKNQTATVTAASQGKQLNVLGHSITTYLNRENTGGDYFVFKCDSPPGLGIPPHVHELDDHIATVLEGEFTITIGNQQYRAVKGDVCFFPRNTPHSFQNTGSKAGSTMWTSVPGANFEAFFNVMANLPAGEPNPAAIAKIFADFKMKIVMPETV